MTDHSTTDYSALANAKCLQFVWKTEAMLRILRAVVTLALEHAEFSAADLPADLLHGGTGICGSVIAELIRQHIIRPVGVWHGTVFFTKEIATKREGRKSAKIGVYELDDRSKAEAFLRAEHKVKALRQEEMALA